MHAYEIALVALSTFAVLATVANLLFSPRLTDSGRSGGPLVSVVIPARNEERAIARTVLAMLAQTYADLEVIVVDDRSTDATPQILASLADPRLRIVEGEEPPAGWLGKPWALEQGSRHATGELLLFVDADVVYEPAAVGAMVDGLEPEAAMLAILPHLEMRGFWENAGMSALVTVLMGVLNVWIVNRTRTPLLGVGGGVGNLVRRGAYESIGGHRALHDAVVDDIGLARQLRAAGHRTTVAFADDFISVRMYHGLREIVEGFTKNAFAVFSGNYAVMLAAVVFVLAFDVAPYFLAFRGHPLAIAAVVLLTIARLILFGAFGYSIASALFLHPVTSLLWIYIVLRSAWVIGIRGHVHWRGRKSARWSGFGR